MNQLIEAKERCEAEGLDMTIDEIFNSVVPPKSGYVQDRARAAEEKNEELTKQIEELRARQYGIEESLFQRIRVDVQEHFQQARLNVDTPSWMHVETFNGKTIKTTVTYKASITDQWVTQIILARHEARLTVVGLGIKWKPHQNSYRMNNKSTTLQLCTDNKCLIVQLFYIDYIPQSLKDILMNPNFTFDGTGVGDDIQKLKSEYGLPCSKSANNGEMAKSRWPGRFSRLGLKDLAFQILGLIMTMKKPLHLTKSNWEARGLSDDQVEHA
ncbi:hypothetical protein FNV43_RR21437 [Rhamnella rubrinervis]|uniref:3'-5' exonuclease domain-containing protein n=1 Tax=Rhamnella rubrinervis TaxID=2594499 RepID=A0A8K0GVD2_9ROSA|nr:hypothetical protein FNV43_RR21437 [Rhamnella rubrinervis]